MTRIELIVNDEQLDLYESTAVALVLQSQNFNELSEKSSSFSRSFTIPRTDNNARILKNVFTFNIADRLAYNKLNAVLKVNGIEIGKGNIIIENDGIGYNELRLTFYFDASPFYQIISRRMLLDCNFNEFDHYYNNQNILASFDDDKDYIYPFIQYNSNGIGEVYVGASSLFADYDRMLPAIKFSAIIKAISKTLGYTIKGNIFDKTEFKSAIFPFAKGKFERDKYYYKRYTFNTACLTNQTLTTNSVIQLTEEDSSGNLKAEGLSIVPFSQYYNQTAVAPITSYSTTNSLKYLSFADNVKCKVAVKCDITINTASSNIIVTSNGSYRDSVIATLTNQATGQVILPTTGSTFASTIQTGTYTLEYITEERFVAHNYYSISVTSNKLNNTISNLTLDVTYIEDYGTTDENRKIQKSVPDNVYSTYSSSNYYRGGANPDYVNVSSGTGAGLYKALQDGGNNNILPQPNLFWSLVAGGVVDIKWSNTIVTAGTILPDITIGTFLKMIAQLFCCTIIVDENTRVVEFYSLEDTYNNINSQLDWSDRIVNIEASVWNTRASAYGQNSIFKFNNAEEVGEIGKGVIQVNDTTLDEDKKVIEIAYGFPQEKLFKQYVFPAITYDYTIMWIKKFIVNATNPYEVAGDDKILIGNYYISTDSTLFGDVRWSKKYEFVSITNKKVIGISANGDRTPAPTQKTIGFNFALNSYYKYINYILSVYKELNCFMILSSNDIANIDYRKTIYIQQFNSVFYLQKINDWTEGKPTKVELLKLI
jgi:hypothetical protein